MLNRRACLWRCIQALDAPTGIAYRPQYNATLLPRAGQRRLLSSRDVARPVSDRQRSRTQVDELSHSGREPWKDSAAAADQRKRARAAQYKSPSRKSIEETPNLAHLGKRDSRIPDSEWNRRKMELRYLQDPLDLADFVRKELGKDKSTEMLQLVRMASHSMLCVVSWNHIIDHYLAKERVSEAFKVYNEMKKRAQFPDSYTYTILLRGLSINAHTSGVLSKALSVYHSMSTPNSRVEPSIIHTNAALRVCARAMDMDALWGVAGKIPERGAGAANTITYYTILNAIRQNVLLNAPKGETENETAARKERGIMEGRRMWEDIVSRWRNADLIIDEALVCSIGRLLLVGSRPRDWDDVLSLVEQTMDIPRLVPRLGTPARQEAGYPHLRAPDVPNQQRFDDDHLSPEKHPMRGDEFLALTPQGVGSAVSNPLSYVSPGNNALSIIQEACQKIVANNASTEYWELLTDPTTYNIVPDAENLNMRLRNLRQNRASASAVKLLQEDMIDKGIVPRAGTFRIAMSTCVRDKNNHNSLRHANQILHIMSKTLEDADCKVVTMYAELTNSFPLAKASDIVDALTNLHPMVKNICLQLTIGGSSKSRNGVGAEPLKGPERDDARNALHKVYGAYDKLLFSNLIEEERKAPFKAERARLSAFIHRVTFKDGLDGKAAREEVFEPASDEADPHAYLKDDTRSGKKEKEDMRPRWKRQGTENIEGRKMWHSPNMRDERVST